MEKEKEIQIVVIYYRGIFFVSDIYFLSLISRFAIYRDDSIVCCGGIVGARGFSQHREQKYLNE
jgi:hypothetical protein